MKTWMFLLLSMLDVSGSLPVPTHDRALLEIQGRWQKPNLRRLADVKCTADALERKIIDELDENEYFFLEGSDAFGVVGGAPKSVDCMSRESYKCPMIFYDDVDFTDEESILTTGATVEQEPCPYCDLHYFSNSSFHNASCETFFCLPDDDIGSVPEEVQFSYEVTRSDSFKTNQYTSSIDNQYRCNWEPSRQVYRVDFKTGVVNAQSTSLFLEKGPLENDIDSPNTANDMGTCTYTVDDVPCTSCRICNSSDPGQYELDCSNIRSGASVTCLEVDVNPLLGYFPKLLVLQSDHTWSPTLAPTAESSAMPSSAPKTNQTSAPVPSQSPSAQPTLGPSQSIAGETTKRDDTLLIVAIVVGVVVLLVFAGCLYYLPQECCRKGKHDKRTSEKRVHPTFPEPFNIKLPTPEELSNELARKSISLPSTNTNHSESWEEKGSGHDGHKHHPHHHHSPHHHHNNHHQHHHHHEHHHSSRPHHHHHRNHHDER